jgi:steroid delta-isomerase-like uncharacterized protein
MKCDSEQLRQIAVRWIEEGWQKGNTAIIDELHSADFVDRDSAGRARDRGGFKQGILSLYQAFPDFSAFIQNLVVDEARQMIAIHWKARGTHQGTYLGIPATGRSIRFKGIEIIRVADGKIAERWGEWDGLNLVQQLKQQG